MLEGFKEELQHIVAGFVDDKQIDLKETPALFVWRYQDDPKIQYELLISEVEPDTIADMDSLH